MSVPLRGGLSLPVELSLLEALSLWLALICRKRGALFPLWRVLERALPDCPSWRLEQLFPDAIELLDSLDFRCEFAVGLPSL